MASHDNDEFIFQLDELKNTTVELEGLIEDLRSNASKLDNKIEELKRLREESQHGR